MYFHSVLQHLYLRSVITFGLIATVSGCTTTHLLRMHSCALRKFHALVPLVLVRTSALFTIPTLLNTHAFGKRPCRAYTAHTHPGTTSPVHLRTGGYLVPCVPTPAPWHDMALAPGSTVHCCVWLRGMPPPLNRRDCLPVLYHHTHYFCLYLFPCSGSARLVPTRIPRPLPPTPVYRTTFNTNCAELCRVARCAARTHEHTPASQHPAV